MTYLETIEWLEGTGMYSKKAGLAQMRRFLELLGSPEKRVPAVHVAGTNGKGTTCALLESMFRASGKKTGLFTSPHLVRYTERIRVNGEEISEENFARLGARVRKAAEALAEEGGAYPTFFMLLTAMGFAYFAEQECDVMVIEVGVGGRLDCTNVLEKPLVTVITSISLDHMKTLGDTIPQIAWEKAGILKPGVPAVAGHNTEEALAVIRARAEEVGAPLYEADKEPAWVLQNDPDGILVATAKYTAGIRLCGNYQVQNLKTALLAAKLLEIPQEAVSEGAKNTAWPGRMQWLPWRGGTDLLLDGAHNSDAAAHLARWCREHLADRDVTLLFSALRRKDVSGVLRELLTDAPFRRIVFARLSDASGMDADEFETVSAPYRGDIPWCAAGSVEEGIALAGKLTGGNGLVVCAGSLYLMGEILKLAEAGREETKDAEV